MMNPDLGHDIFSISLLNFYDYNLILYNIINYINEEMVEGECLTSDIRVIFQNN